MSSNPAAAKTSASPTLPAVMPTAPASIWRRPISTHLCVLTCGLRSRPCRAAKPCMRSMLSCMTSASTIGAGVSTRSTSASSARWSRFTLYSSLLHRSADHLDLDRTVQWQPGDTDRGARVPSVLAQHLDEEVTGRIGDPRLQTELRGAGHEDQHLHDPDPVQVTHRLHGGGERVERGMAREPSRRLHVDVAADNALA